MRQTNGTTTERQKKEVFNEVKLCNSTTLLENLDAVPNFFCLAWTLQGHSAIIKDELSCCESTKKGIRGTHKSYEASVQTRNLKGEGKRKMLQETADETTGARRGRASGNCTPLGNDPSTPGRKSTARRRTPNRIPPSPLHTPPTAPQSSDTRELRIDPNFVPSDTPLTKRKLKTTRTHPPHTRLQSRLQALEEIEEPFGE
jgi:hypothetical protein